MRLTTRDSKLLRDIALSHALTRDQILELGYFGSITRANTRLRELGHENLVRRLQTPFFGQSIYCLGKRGVDVIGERIALLVCGRRESPRFLQHALTLTNVRIALLSKFGGQWRFEQQLWRKLSLATDRQVRPDGLLLTSIATFVEVDMGHVTPSKYREKLKGYQELALSQSSKDLYGFSSFQLLTVTTGKTRARHLHRLTPSKAGYEHRIHTFEEIGVDPISSWS